MELFDITIAKLSGDSREIKGLTAKVRMSELRQMVCAELAVQNHEFVLVQGDRAYALDDDTRTLSELDIKEGVELNIIVVAWVKDIVGRWEPAPEDNSAWMKGMTVAENGTFECRSGQVIDGLLRVLSVSERRINFKRQCAGANDHIFVVEEDGRTMKGRCVQSGCTYTLTKR